MSFRYRDRFVAVALAMGATLYWPAHANASRVAGAHVAVVSQSNGSARLLVTVPSVAAGVRIDPRAVTVTLAGSQATVTTSAVSHPGLPELQRRAVLVVDASGSMAVDLGQARRAALAYASAVPSDVEVGLVVFSDRARLVVPPTTSRTRLRSALARLTAAGETSLYDGLALGLHVLGGSGEREIVVLSDGADTRSRISGIQIQDLVHRAGARIDAVAFRTNDTVRRTLERLVAVGERGRLTEARDAADLATAFSTAARSFEAAITLDVAVPRDLRGRSVRVDVEVQTSTGQVTAATICRFASSTVAHTATAGGSKGGGQLRGSQALYLILLFLFVGFAGLALAALLGVESRRSPQSRTKQLLGRYTFLAPAASQPNLDEPRPGNGALARRAIAIADKVAADPARRTKLAAKLTRADVRFTPSEWIVVQSLLVLAGLGFGSLLLGNFVVGLVLAILGYFGSSVWLANKGRRRARAFDEHLPNALQLIAGSLRAGFSLEQALDALAKEGREPVSGEVHRALSDARLGIPVEDALDRVAERMDSIDFRWVVMAVRIQREVGGNLGEVLLNTAGMMRDRARLRRQVKVLSAEGRLSAYVLLGLPIVISLYLLAFRRAYLHPLYSEPLGIGMLAFAVVLLAAGGAWMRKVVAVEV